ncbi:helix-turn-helix domain-containing protein [Exiguobacterium sp. S22-S28]|uniref:helix-turn-helix domain-containing protein n=1 Tax=Exiguobacterium sp. S22-S28 TaxID=3342768 RepID=UPI00372D6C5C
MAKSNFLTINLKNIRTMFGYTLNDIAIKTGITFERLHYIQAGFDSPTMEEVVLLAKVFHVKPIYFYKNDSLHNKKMVVNSEHMSFRFIERD